MHIHDIFLPWEYPKEDVLKKHRFWTEQYALQTFLAFNNHFEVMWAGYYMHMLHAEKLKEAFPSYRQERHVPTSFWIRRKA